ncbi:MAG: choice-of-anchor Q domain-containing protein, partial [Chloroflexota bacterium]
ITVSDGSLTASDSFALTIRAVNDVPTISPIPNQPVNPNAPSDPIPFTIDDLETAATKLTLTGISSNPTFVPNASIVFGGSGANRNVTLTPAAGQTGTTTITITVRDGSSATASTSFVYSVFPLGNDLTVDTTSDLDLQSCTTAPSDCSLRGAINRANTISGADSISFNPTIFATPQTISLLSSLPQITSPITLEGTGANLVTISGANSYQVFKINSGAALTLNKVTVANGKLSGGDQYTSGGGILNSGTLTINDSTLSANHANYGGAVDNLGTLTISNSLISGNGADQNGGGILNAGALTITNSTFSGNSAVHKGGALYNNGAAAQITGGSFSSNSADYGGGVANESGTLLLTVSGATFNGNSATTDGGGLWNYLDATLTVTTSTFTSNSAGNYGAGMYNLSTHAVSVSASTFTNNTSGIGGGALTVYGLMTTVSDSTFTSNSAESGGGILNFGTLAVNSSTFVSNTAPGEGGGIDNFGNLTVTNSTFYGNSSTGDEGGNGGAINNANNNMTVKNSTLVGNSARHGGGITNSTTASASFKLSNSIVANNTAVGSPDANGTITSMGYNLISNTQGATGLGGSDLINGAAVPLNLGPLANNGGLTQTMALLSDSVAINAGDPAIVSPSSYDQRGVGFPRVVANRIDIGAFEMPNTAPTISNITNKSTNEDTSTGAITFTVGDAETPSKITPTGASSNTTLVPNANIVFGGSGTNRTVTILPATDKSGTSTITVTMSDGTLTASDTFVLTVTAVNDAPKISNVTDYYTVVNQPTSTLPVTVSDVDTAAASLILSGSSTNTALVPNGNIVFGGSGGNRTVRVTPALNASGSTTITLTVSDGTLTATDTFVLAVSTATDTPIFSNGFESGNLSGWTASTGTLSAATGAHLTASTYGLQVPIASTASAYVTDDSPNAEAHYRARFYFDPNSLVMANGSNFFLVYAYQGTSTVVLQMQMQFSNGSYQVRTGALNDAGSVVYTSYVTISDAPHMIELNWLASSAVGANNGTLTTWIDQVQQPTLSGIDNDTRRIDRVRLGTVAGLDAGTSGTIYFDAFVSRRLTYIGAEVGGLEIAPEGIDTLTPEATETVTQEVTLPPEATDVVAPVSNETATPEVTLPPAMTDVVAPEPTLTPTSTSTPTPFSVPLYQTMDDGAPLWQATSGWQLSADGAFGGSGLSWTVSATGQLETLKLQVPIDLRTAQHPQLTFQSRLASASLPEVQISVDGTNAQTVAVVQPSTDWTAVTVDLSAYSGQTVYIQLVWLSPVTVDGQAADTWQVDNLSVLDVPPTVAPTDIPTLTATVISTSEAPTEIVPTVVPTAESSETVAPTNSPEATQATDTATSTPQPTDTPTATDTPVTEQTPHAQG